jgi:hypothetical protein
MTDTDFDLEPMHTPDEGSYVGTVTDVELTVIDLKEGPTEFQRFTFAINMKGQAEPYIIDAIAATKDSKGMNAYGNGRMKLTRWVQALLGGLPKLNRDALVGAQALCVLDLDQNGFMRIADVVALPKGAD